MSTPSNTPKGLHWANKASRNPVTGDFIVSDLANDTYREGYDRIFGPSKLELQAERERLANAVSKTIEILREKASQAKDAK